MKSEMDANERCVAATTRSCYALTEWIIKYNFYDTFSLILFLFLLTLPFYFACHMITFRFLFFFLISQHLHSYTFVALTVFIYHISVSIFSLPYFIDADVGPKGRHIISNDMNIKTCFHSLSASPVKEKSPKETYLRNRVAHIHTNQFIIRPLIQYRAREIHYTSWACRIVQLMKIKFTRNSVIYVLSFGWTRSDFISQRVWMLSWSCDHIHV